MRTHLLFIPLAGLISACSDPAADASARFAKDIPIQFQGEENQSRHALVKTAVDTVLNVCSVDDYADEISAISASWDAQGEQYRQEFGWYETVNLEARFHNGEHCFYSVGEGFKPGIVVTKSFCRSKCGGQEFVPLSGDDIIPLSLSDFGDRRALDAFTHTVQAWPEVRRNFWSMEEAGHKKLSSQAFLTLEQQDTDVNPLAGRVCQQLEQSGVHRSVDFKVTDVGSISFDAKTQLMTSDTLATFTCQGGQLIGPLR